MTVTLAPAPKGGTVDDALVMDQNLKARGVTECSYDDGTYTCGTQGLPKGVYAVQVTDSIQPGEGTASTAVIITSVEGFDPRVGTSNIEVGTGKVDPAEDQYVLGTVGEKTQVPLTGWGPGRALSLRVIADGGKVVERLTLTTEADGAKQAVLAALPAGAYYTLEVTDGTWTSTVPLDIS